MVTDPVGVEKLKSGIDFLAGLVYKILKGGHYMHLGIESLPQKALVGEGNAVIADVAGKGFFLFAIRFGKQKVHADGPGGFPGNELEGDHIFPAQPVAQVELGKIRTVDGGKVAQQEERTAYKPASVAAVGRGIRGLGVQGGGGKSRQKQEEDFLLHVHSVSVMDAAKVPGRFGRWRSLKLRKAVAGCGVEGV